MERSSKTEQENSEDRDLLRRYVKCGSRGAFDALVNRHLNFVYSVCMRALGNRQLAEDATQIVFMVLARKASGLSPRVFLPAWLFETARLTAKDVRRAEMRRAHYEGKAIRESIRNMNESPAVWLDIEPVLDRLIARLSVDERNALLLRFYEDRDFDEIARDLGATEAAARMRVSRAVQKLRDWLARDGIGISTSALLALIVGPAGRYISPSTNLSSRVFEASLSSHASMITKGVVKTMWTFKVKAMASAAVVAAVAVGTVVVLSGKGDTTPVLHIKPRYYTGRVIDSMGRPVAGADVVAVDYEMDPPRVQLPHQGRYGQMLTNVQTITVRTPTSTTDSSGRFQTATRVHDFIRPMNCDVMADSGKQVGFGRLAYGTPGTVKLLPPADIQFRIVDTNGKPVAHLRLLPIDLVLGTNDYDLTKCYPRRWDATSDKSGTAAWTGLPSGCKVSVQVDDPRFAHLRYRCAVPHNSTVSTQRIVVDSGGEIQGRLVERGTGKPIANATIFADSFEAADGRYQSAQVSSDAKGWYRIPKLAAGRYQVSGALTGSEPLDLCSVSQWTVYVKTGRTTTAPPIGFVPPAIITGTIDGAVPRDNMLDLTVTSSRDHVPLELVAAPPKRGADPAFTEYLMPGVTYTFRVDSPQFTSAPVTVIAKQGVNPSVHLSARAKAAGTLPHPPAAQ